MSWFKDEWVPIMRWLGKNALRIYAGLALAYLAVPVLYTFAFSFNDAGRQNLVWQGFTL